ncbi:MAG TPA: hypothetical protein VFI91_06870 [Longimicrobiaceae bacterium]|nr:hypothetical protein [Longimicrobiaceae bacterium]
MRQQSRLYLCAWAIFVAIGSCAPESSSSGSGLTEDTLPSSSVQAPAPSSGTSAPPAPDTAWVVTATGVGPIRIGMALDELRGALDGGLREPDSLSAACDYVFPTDYPAVAVMIVGDTVARIDVDSASIATAEGARVGDEASLVAQLYPAGLSTMPHKYTEGEYLIVTPSAPADTMNRLIFETSPEGRIDRYRAGRVPEVQWVEGCS